MNLGNCLMTEKTVKHVQDQGRCKNNNETFKNQIDEKLQSLEKNICFNPETDDPITIKEIKFVLNKLKNGKAGGPDGIINEVIKYSCNITLKSLSKLFNLILKSGHYPKQWNKSYLFLLYKSGSKSYPSNYRGIYYIGSLLFADDLLVISESKEGLQNTINKLSDFCDN